MNTMFSSSRRTNYQPMLAALLVGVLVSACGGGSSSNNSMVQATELTINRALINVELNDGWVCEFPDGRFGAFSFLADSTGYYDGLIPDGEGSYAIEFRSPYTYTITSENSVDILYEFASGNTLEEFLTDITFANIDEFTGISNVEGFMSCFRANFVEDLNNPSSTIMNFRHTSSGSYYR